MTWRALAQALHREAQERSDGIAPSLDADPPAEFIEWADELERDPRFAAMRVPDVVDYALLPPDSDSAHLNDSDSWLWAAEVLGIADAGDETAGVARIDISANTIEEFASRQSDPAHAAELLRAFVASARQRPLRLWQ